MTTSFYDRRCSTCQHFLREYCAPHTQYGWCERPNPQLVFPTVRGGRKEFDSAGQIYVNDGCICNFYVTRTFEAK